MTRSTTVLDRQSVAGADADFDFRLDLRVVEAAVPVAALLRSTSDNCGSSCPGACTSRTSDPA